MVAICVILLWLLVAIKTTIALWKGDLNYGPCVKHNETTRGVVEFEDVKSEMVHDLESGAKTG